MKKKSLLRKLQGYAYPGQDPSCSIIFRLIVKLGLSDRLNSRAWGLGIRTQTLRFEILNPKHPSPKKISTIYNSEVCTPSLKYKERLDHNILSNGEKQIGNDESGSGKRRHSRKPWFSNVFVCCVVSSPVIARSAATRQSSLFKCGVRKSECGNGNKLTQSRGAAEKYKPEIGRT